MLAEPSRKTVVGVKVGPGPNSLTVWFAPAFAMGCALQVGDCGTSPAKSGVAVPLIWMSSISRPGELTPESEATRKRNRTALPPKLVPRFTFAVRKAG